MRGVFLLMQVASLEFLISNTVPLLFPLPQEDGPNIAHPASRDQMGLEL